MIEVRTLADDVWDIVDALAPNTYRGEIVDGDGRPTTPPIDATGRAEGYLIVYFGAGRATVSRLVAVPLNVSWSFQVTCAGGDDERCLWVVDLVRAALTGRRLTASTGKLQELTDPGPLRRNDAVQPARVSLPLMFGLFV